VADPQVIKDNRWPHSVALLEVARATSCKTGLATMSYRKEVDHVLRSLDLDRLLNVVLTREDVDNPKPDPEIYLLAAQRLGVEPRDCIVIEDSPSGVRAAVAAQMNVVALATPFTKAGLHASEPLEHAWVVHDGEKLIETVAERIAEHGRVGHC
jgi:beta-phosphoglucomutase-like phosphatase (HAD superfamily)